MPTSFQVWGPLLLYESWYRFDQATTRRASGHTAFDLIDAAWHNSEHVNVLELATVCGECETDHLVFQAWVVPVLDVAVGGPQLFVPRQPVSLLGTAPVSLLHGCRNRQRARKVQLSTEYCWLL